MLIIPPILINLKERRSRNGYRDIEAIMHEIQLQYSNGMYRRISGDIYFKNIPRELWILWYSDNHDVLSMRHMDDLVAKARQGEVNLQDAYMKLVDLRHALAQEFELINQVTRKEY